MPKPSMPWESWLMPKASCAATEDAELIARICGGDSEAFEVLYKRYYPKLFRFALRVTRRLDQVEEIINDTLYVVWQKAASYRPECRASTWIFGIAYNKCLKANASQPAGEHLELEEADDLLPGVQDSGMKQLELEDWVAFAFAKLPPDQRAVLELVYHQGLHYQEIAEIMGCPENTVKTRMFHARKKIKSLLPDLAADGQGDLL